MTAVVWALLWLPEVLTVNVALRPPTALNLTSDHFVHTLTWEPSANAPTGVFYQVSVIEERESSWTPVEGCEHVQQLLFCNLTEAFPDNRSKYFIKVSAQLDSEEASAPHEHEQLSPIRDTLLDLPLVNVSDCGLDLCVDLRPRLQHLWNIYNSLRYQLKTESSDGHIHSLEDFRSLSRRTVKDLARGRRYCVSVRFSDSLAPRESDFSPPQCAFTSDAPAPDWWIAVLLCLLVVLVLPIVGLLVHTGFITVKTRTLPLVLTSLREIRPVRLLQEPAASVSSISALEPSPGQNMCNLYMINPVCYKGGYQVREKPDRCSSSSTSSSWPLQPELPPEAHLPLMASPEEENYGMRPEPFTITDLFHEEEEEEEDKNKEDELQEVDLLSLTFGRPAEDDGDQDQDQESAQEEAGEIAVLQLQEEDSAGEETFPYLSRF